MPRAWAKSSEADDVTLLNGKSGFWSIIKKPKKLLQIGYSTTHMPLAKVQSFTDALVLVQVMEKLAAGTTSDHTNWGNGIDKYLTAAGFDISTSRRTNFILSHTQEAVRHQITCSQNSRDTLLSHWVSAPTPALVFVAKLEMRTLPEWLRPPVKKLDLAERIIAGEIVRARLERGLAAFPTPLSMAEYENWEGRHGDGPNEDMIGFIDIMMDSRGTSQDSTVDVVP